MNSTTPGKLSARTTYVTPTAPDYPIPAPFERGQWVRVNGLHGLFKIVNGNRDGSLLLYGGSMTQFRSVHADSVRPATKSEIRKAGK